MRHEIRHNAMGLLALAAVLVLGKADPILCQETSQSRAPFPEAKMKEMRKKAAHRRRRIIMNNDGNDCRNPKPDEPKTPENFLSKRTSPLLGSHVDAIFYCDGVFNSYTHMSQESELRGHGDQYAVDWAWELARQGRDPLAIITEFGHAHGMEVFWSMRMNDTHDAADPALLCKWKQEHPDYLMGKKGDRFAAGAGRWSAVNYALPEVREKVFRIFTDVCTRYDVDGVEMDFFRHPVFFKPQMLGEPVTQEHCDMMTDLVRRVRAMTEEVAAKRGRPLLIAARTPDSVGYCKAIGLDVERWMQEDLMDLWGVTCYFRLNPWEESVRLGHKYGVPVYPSLSESRIKGDAGKMRNSIEAYRARAMNAWSAGADGIYLFNFFNPKSRLWWELGDPNVLAGLDKLYCVSYRSARDAGRWLAGGERFVVAPHLSPEDPMALSLGEKKSIVLCVGDDLARGKAGRIAPSVNLEIQAEKLARADDLVVALNGKVLTGGAFSEGRVEFILSPEHVVKGANQIEVSLKPEAGSGVTLRDLRLWVRFAEAKR